MFSLLARGAGPFLQRLHFFTDCKEISLYGHAIALVNITKWAKQSRVNALGKRICYITLMRVIKLRALPQQPQAERRKMSEFEGFFFLLSQAVLYTRVLLGLAKVRRWGSSGKCAMFMCSVQCPTCLTE